VYTVKVMDPENQTIVKIVGLYPRPAEQTKRLEVKL
jgi:hypothetical protein